MSEYRFLEHSRPVILLAEITLQTNLPDGALRELDTAFMAFVAQVVKGWRDAGAEYDRGELRYLGSGVSHVLPWASHDSVEEIAAWHERIRDAAAGIPR